MSSDLVMPGLEETRFGHESAKSPSVLSDDTVRSSSSLRLRVPTGKQIDTQIGTVHNLCVDGLLTDFYQITMAYAYWKCGKHEENSVFDAYFRKCPFGGEYTIVAGINECVRFLNTFGYNDSQIAYLKKQMPHVDPAFFVYLKGLDASSLNVYGMREGEIVFPNQPLLRLEGPLIVCQLLETTLLNLLNFPSLITTNAARYRQAATSSEGSRPVLIEMGTRRAQGPDGAMSASRYSYLGGFDATSNVKAGHAFSIPIKGTHAHAFVTSFTSLDEVRIPGDSLVGADFKDVVLANRSKLGYEATNDGELAAFISYASAFPHSALALVDTYDTLLSGVPNFLCVAVSLYEKGVRPVGVRLDSGDLAYLSKEAKKMFLELSKSKDFDFSEDIRAHIRQLKVCASNDINEKTLKSLNEQGHGIDIYGIGTNLVTCQAQPALGMVYKLVELNGEPRMKLSQEFTKVSVPCRKAVYRLYNSSGVPLVDLMQGVDEPRPEPGKRLFCRHLFDETKRCYVTPAQVEDLLVKIWGHDAVRLPTLAQARDYCQRRLEKFRQDILRPLNPTPYKLAVSDQFFHFFKGLWQQQAPIKEIQ